MQGPKIDFIQTNHIALPSRVSAIACSANKIFIGTVEGYLQVVSGQCGEPASELFKDTAAIEGIMYDYEGKVIFATEYNLTVLDRDLKIKKAHFWHPHTIRIHSLIILALTYLSGRRIIPSLDHKKVYWWGNRNALSIINLDSLEEIQFPMIIEAIGARLITYDVMPISEKLIYILFQEGTYKMIYYYNLSAKSLIGCWRYENPESIFR